MKRTAHLTIPTLLVLLLVPTPGHTAPPEEYKPDTCWVMFWNLENLYDAEDDPDVEIRDAMEPQDLAEKLRRLRATIGRVNWGRGPDVLGVCEVESGDLVQRLVGDGYRVIHHKGEYRRGNNTALATRLPVDGEPEHLDPGITGRTILHAKLEWGEERLHVFVLHMKSKFNPKTGTYETRQDEEIRTKEAVFLAGRIAKLLEADPEANLVVMGDFNEHYRDSLFRKELLARELRRGEKLPTAKDDDRRLLNLGAALQQSFPGGGTAYHHPNWSIIDNFLVSEPLIAPGGLETSPFEAQIGVSWDLLNKYGQPDHFRRKFPNCVSDHLPILLRIRR